MKVQVTRQRAARSMAALVAASALHAGHARAQARSGLEASYGAAKVMVAVGGQVEFTGEAASLEDDLEPSWGAGLSYMARVHRHFAIGALLAFQSWQSERGSQADRERNIAIDAAAVPAGVMPINRDVELYLALGLGFSMNVIGDAAAALEATGVEPDPTVPLEIDEAIHFVVLPVLGARLALSEDAGVLAELGYAVRWYEHELRAWVDVARDAAVERPIELSLGQVTFALGAFF